MNDKRTVSISKTIQKIPYVNILKPFKGKLNIKGRVSITLDGLDKALEFDVEIYPQYPFKAYDSETIKFINRDFLEYNHVMGDGTICIHTSHNITLEKKLLIDFESLKNWIIKYYLNNDLDVHYEHLIVPESTFKDSTFAYIFSDVDYVFSKGQFGFVNLSFLSEGKSKDKPVHNYLTQDFTGEYGKEITLCNWSEVYKNIGRHNHGIFFFTEDQPATYKRFAFTDWKDFYLLFSNEFLKFLHHCEKKYLEQKRKGQPIPLYIGYKISESEIHWLVAILEIGKFPIKGVKENQKWDTHLIEGKIDWALSRNSSYKYFFGRGAFSKKITTKRILIIGVGAIGSNVARTLVKCGCTNIDLTDYDVKEPENVCRAEFQFASGIADKVEEISNTLSHISPFVNIHTVNQVYFEVMSKALFGESEAKKELEDFLNMYDLIFDCSTDNDLMYVLNSLDLKGELINLSITNHAKELVCAFYPNVYDFVIKQYSEILDNDIEDLYNPTGCWSPTFKGSYNDINMLVQTALKKINHIYERDLPMDNFIVESKKDETINFKIIQY